MPGETLQLEARLKDYISGEIGKISQKMDDFGKQSETAMQKASRGTTDFLNVAKGMILAQVGLASVSQAFQTLKNIIGGSITAYDRQFRAEAQLRNSLGYTSTALLTQAATIQKVTRFGDEQVLEAQAMMAQFIREEDIIKKLTPAVVNLAAAKGMDLRSAADLVTKSISSTTSMLSRYGITLTAGVGTTARAEEAVKKLNAAFGGQAEAIASGGTGPLVKMGNAMGDIGEKFGQVLEPTIIQMVDLLNRSLLPTLENAVQMVDRLLNPKEYKARKEKESALAAMKEEYGKLKETLEAFTDFTQEGKLSEAQIIASRIFSGIDLDPAKIEETRKRYGELGKEIAKLQKELSPGGEKKGGGILSTGATEKDDFNKWLSDQMEKIRTDNKTNQDKTLEDIVANQNAIADAKRGFYQAEIALTDDRYLREKLLLAEQRDYEINNTAKTEEEKYWIREKYRVLMKGIDQKEKEEGKKEDKKETDTKVKNAELIADYTIGTFQNIARASKAVSAMQKGLDVAQATANTALAVTKSLDKPWLIPFIIAVGATQVAIIASQKYAGGGIVGGGSPSQGDVVPAMLTPGEMVLNNAQQSNLFSMLQRPNVSNSSSVNVNINVGSGGTYDMNAARYTVDALAPVLGDALVRAKNEGRLREYEGA